VYTFDVYRECVHKRPIYVAIDRYTSQKRPEYIAKETYIRRHTDCIHHKRPRERVYTREAVYTHYNTLYTHIITDCIHTSPQTIYITSEKTVYTTREKRPKTLCTTRDLERDFRLYTQETSPVYTYTGESLRVYIHIFAYTGEISCQETSPVCQRDLERDFRLYTQATSRVYSQRLYTQVATKTVCTRDLERDLERDLARDLESDLERDLERDLESDLERDFPTF